MVVTLTSAVKCVILFTCLCASKGLRLPQFVRLGTDFSKDLGPIAVWRGFLSLYTIEMLVIQRVGMTDDWPYKDLLVGVRPHRILCGR